MAGSMHAMSEEATPQQLGITYTAASAANKLVLLLLPAGTEESCSEKSTLCSGQRILCTRMRTDEHFKSCGEEAHSQDTLKVVTVT